MPTVPMKYRTDWLLYQIPFLVLKNHVALNKGYIAVWQKNQVHSASQIFKAVVKLHGCGLILRQKKDGWIVPYVISPRGQKVLDSLLEIEQRLNGD